MSANGLYFFLNQEILQDLEDDDFKESGSFFRIGRASRQSSMHGGATNALAE